MHLITEIYFEIIKLLIEFTILRVKASVNFNLESLKHPLQDANIIFIQHKSQINN